MLTPSLPSFATLISDLDEVPGHLKLHRMREAGREGPRKEHRHIRCTLGSGSIVQQNRCCSSN